MGLLLRLEGRAGKLLEDVAWNERKGHGQEFHSADRRALLPVPSLLGGQVEAVGTGQGTRTGRGCGDQAQAQRQHVPLTPREPPSRNTRVHGGPAPRG